MVAPFRSESSWAESLRYEQYDGRGSDVPIYSDSIVEFMVPWGSRSAGVGTVLQVKVGRRDAAWAMTLRVD